MYFSLKKQSSFYGEKSCFFFIFRIMNLKTFLHLTFVQITICFSTLFVKFFQSEHQTRHSHCWQENLRMARRNRSQVRLLSTRWRHSPGKAPSVTSFLLPVATTTTTWAAWIRPPVAARPPPYAATPRVSSAAARWLAWTGARATASGTPSLPAWRTTRTVIACLPTESCPRPLRSPCRCHKMTLIKLEDWVRLQTPTTILGKKI